MKQILTWIQQHMVISILMGMVIGLFVGQLWDVTLLKSAITPLSILMVYPVMVTIQFKSLLEKGSIKLHLAAQIINFIVLPLMAYLFGILFFPTKLDFRLGILLIALLPTSGMTISWTVFAKGNVNEAIKMVVIGMILGGVLAPIYINLLLGSDISISFMDIFIQMVYIVFLPLVLGFLTQLGLKKKYGNNKFEESIKPFFPKFSTLAVVILITIVMSLRSKLIISQPLILLEIIVPVVLGYVIMIVLLHYIGTKLFQYENKVALINGTMVRSLSLALAIALSLFDGSNPQVALIIAIAYIVQVQFAAMYVKYSLRTHKKLQLGEQR